MALHSRALNSYFSFVGSDFKNSIPLANIIILAISLAIVLACLVAQRPYIRWARSNGNSPANYGLAVGFILIAYVLEIAVLVRSEKSSREKYSFYVIYVFDIAASLASQVLVLSIFTNLAEASHKIIWRVVLGVLSLLAIAEVAVEIVVVYYEINQYNRYLSAVLYYGFVTEAIGLTFAVVALLTGIILTGYTTAKVQRFSKAFLGPILLALILFILYFALVIGTDAVQIWIYSHPIFFTTVSQYYSNRNIQYLDIAAIIRTIFWAIMLALILVAAALGVRKVEPVKPIEPEMGTRVDV